MTEIDWWVWWKPSIVEELKSERALIGGIFTSLGMRVKAWYFCDIENRERERVCSIV